jgi:hypothetical protein
MSGAVFANGHWRRRDPLKGLSPAMRAALDAAWVQLQGATKAK